jgi:hypothetical protein
VVKIVSHVQQLFISAMLPKIRRLWQLKVVIFLHGSLICAVLKYNKANVPLIPSRKKLKAAIKYQLQV